SRLLLCCSLSSRSTVDTSCCSGVSVASGVSVVPGVSVLGSVIIEPSCVGSGYVNAFGDPLDTVAGHLVVDDFGSAGRDVVDRQRGTRNHVPRCSPVVLESGPNRVAVVICHHCCPFSLVHAIRADGEHGPPTPRPPGLRARRRRWHTHDGPGSGHTPRPRSRTARRPPAVSPKRSGHRTPAPCRCTRRRPDVRPPGSPARAGCPAISGGCSWCGTPLKWRPAGTAGRCVTLSSPDLGLSHRHRYSDSNRRAAPAADLRAVVENGRGEGPPMPEEAGAAPGGSSPTPGWGSWVGRRTATRQQPRGVRRLGVGAAH